MTKYFINHWTWPLGALVVTETPAPLCFCFHPQNPLDMQVTTAANVCHSLCVYTIKSSKGWSLATRPKDAGSEGFIILQTQASKEMVGISDRSH